MPTKTTFGVFIFAAMALVFFNSGCNGKNSDAFGEFTMPSQKPPAQPPPPTDPNPTGDPDFNTKNFYVGLSPADNTIAYVHNTSGFSNRCTVPKSTSASQDITCIVEIPEGELYNLGLNLLFNVPENFCAYLRRDTYWHYSRPIGYGPSAISVSTVVNGGVTTNTCSVDGAPLPNCNAHPEVSLSFNPDNFSVSDPICNYDCCKGSYSIQQTIDDQDAGTITSNSRNGIWGASFSSCIGGAGRTSWPAGLDVDGIPMFVVTPAQAGLNEVYNLFPPILLFAPLNVASNRSIANYYTPALHTHTGFFTPTTSNKPYFMDPIDDLSGDLIQGKYVPNDAYTFSCLDNGFELLHRIRVYVREWDTRSNYVQFITTEGASGTPDSGVGSDCNNFSDGTMFDTCNDFSALDDFLDSFGGSYNTTPGNSGNRRNYFPRTDVYP